MIKVAFQLLLDCNQSEVPLFHTSVTLLPGWDLHHVKSRTATSTLFFNKISTFKKFPQNQEKAQKLLSMLRFLHHKINYTVPYLVMYVLIVRGR